MYPAACGKFASFWLMYQVWQSESFTTEPPCKELDLRVLIFGEEKSWEKFNFENLVAEQRADLRIHAQKNEKKITLSQTIALCSYTDHNRACFRLYYFFSPLQFFRNQTKTIV